MIPQIQMYQEHLAARKHIFINITHKTLSLWRHQHTDMPTPTCIYTYNTESSESYGPNSPVSLQVGYPSEIKGYGEEQIAQTVVVVENC